ncbi:hypothetical protein BH23CHL2_BH23CHL2_01370 [soil metagenome]
MTVALGCTWFDGLAEQPGIIDMVDFVEVPGWLLDHNFERPHERLVLHNLEQDWSMAAVDAIDSTWPDRLDDAIRLTRTPWFSLHLGFAAEQVHFDGHMLPVSWPLPRRELMGRLVEVTNEARLHCPLQVLLENLDYCPEGAYEHVCEPEFIAEVIEMTGAGLLFDLAHWRVSSSWLGFDPIEALERMPMERTVEVHLSSPRPLADGSGRLDDCHDTLESYDFELLDAVLERTRPRAITIEYVRDSVQLRDEIGKVRSFVEHRSTSDGMEIVN